MRLKECAQLLEKPAQLKSPENKYMNLKMNPKADRKPVKGEKD